MTSDEPMVVARVGDATGTHIEPPLDPAWDEATKIRWQAAVVAHDTGLTIRIHPHTGPDGRTQYGITIGDVRRGGQTSVAMRPYRDAWDVLNHISTGAQAVRNALAHEERP